MADTQPQKLPPKDPLDYLSDSARGRVDTELLRIRAKWLRIDSLRTPADARAKTAAKLDCLAEIYNLYATELAREGVSLTHSILANIVPILVFRAAKDFGWLSPWRGDFIRAIEISGTGAESLLGISLDPIPENELRDCKLSPGFGMRFKLSLGSLILEWHSRAGETAPKPNGAEPAQPGATDGESVQKSVPGRSKDILALFVGSTPEVNKRRSIVFQNMEMSTADLCRRFDFDQVPTPWDDGTTWVEAYNGERRATVDSIVSKHRAEFRKSSS